MESIKKIIRQLQSSAIRRKKLIIPILHKLKSDGSEKYIKFLALRHINPKRFYILLSGISFITALFISSAFAFGIMQSGEEIVLAQNYSESSYNTVHAKLLHDTSILIPGTVLSNETANIYSRRNGIVEDIYFDIGDKIVKGEVVALLLPQGVEGQSAAKIAEKSAMKMQAESNHINAQSVAIEFVSKAEQQIEEKRTILEIAKREQAGLIKSMSQSAENVVQMRDQAFIATRDARQVMERILIGSNSRMSGEINERDILPEIGSLSANHIERYEIIPIFNELKNREDIYLRTKESEKDDALNDILSKTQEAFLRLHDLLAITSISPIYQPGRNTERDPTDIINKIHNIQDNVLKKKEKWQDSLFVYKALIASEPELYKAMLGEMNNAQSNKVKLMTSQLQTAGDNYNLIESQQKQMIERAEKAIQIANASLYAERAQSGHRKILSPFSGIISKRFINVGEVVTTSNAAFELVDVPTSLAKEAKTEIVFGLPEHLITSINVGDTVIFLLPGDDEIVYEAIVSRKSPQVDIKTRTITVQAKIEDALSLPHNSNIRVRIDVYGEPVYNVPSYAVKREEENNILWILDMETNEPVRKKVTVISEDGEFAEVSGAIDSETLIILDPPDLFISISDQNTP